MIKSMRNEGTANLSVPGQSDIKGEKSTEGRENISEARSEQASSMLPYESQWSKYLPLLRLHM